MGIGDAIGEDAVTLPSSMAASPFVRSSVLVTALTLGAAAGLFLLLPAFRAVPNDLSRIATVLDAVRHAPPPAIVVFGDSRTESAVDAAQLTRELPGRPLAYNLAWHAQSLEHAFVLHDELPDSVNTVIVVVGLQDLAQATAVDSRIYRAMRAYGSTPSVKTLAVLERAFGRDVSQPWRMSAIAVRWDARWGVQRVFDTGLRYLARRDLMFERERRDLFFPTAYTTRLDATRFDRRFETGVTKVPGTAVSSGKALLLHELGSMSRRRAIRIVLVLPAVRPRGMLPDYDRRVRDLVELGKAEGVEIVDLTRLLPDEDFVDDVHTTTAGARKFTAAIAEHCRGR